MFAAILVLAALVVIFHIITRQYRAPDLSQYDSPQDPLVKSASEISAQHDDAVARLTEFHKVSSIKVQDQRRRMEDLFTQEVDAQINPVDVNGIPSEWVLAEGADPDRRLLYIHGGAFRVGSPRSHRYITAELSKRAGVAVLAIDYRMQPEHKTTACHEDSQIAYQWIVNNGPDGAGTAKELYIAGDSAGGNLTLSVVAWARDNALPAATGVIALAPLTDATMSSPTWKSNQKSDPFLGPSLGQLVKAPLSVVHLFQRISAGALPNDPMISPLLGDLKGLPPILIQASVDEMLYGDSQRYANKARLAGTDVTLQLWPKLVHVFQGFGPDLPEACDALDLISQFISVQSAVSANKTK